MELCWTEPYGKREMLACCLRLQGQAGDPGLKGSRYLGVSAVVISS
jgi:hypothetical protein